MATLNEIFVTLIVTIVFVIIIIIVKVQEVDEDVKKIKNKLDGIHKDLNKNTKAY